MVLMQRHASCPPSYYSGSQLPMGNDDSVTQQLSSYNQSSSYSGYRSASTRRKSFHTAKSSSSSSNSTKTLPKWVLRAAYIIVLMSWLSAFRVNGRLAQVYEDLGSEIEALGVQHAESKRFLEDAKRSSKNLKKEHKKLKRTQRLLQHEIRMKEEIYETYLSDTEKEDAMKAMKSQSTADIGATWIQQRQEALYGKIYHLQNFVQEQARKRSLEKYGPGPHYVQFTIQPHNKTMTEQFVVELAPLDLVPHSVETFLDMATNGLWDNTVFYHHRSQNHVVAAAPVNYGTFDTKHYHFTARGYNGVSYPEYSPAYPHEEYTIGFSGKGPNFYINTMNNRKHHGPGGQGHHGLPTDADPCFGKIVEGTSVLPSLMPGTHRNNGGADPVSWHDFDLTQIVRLELLKGYSI